MKINVYLTFEDKCKEAFDFYKSIFGGEFESISRFADMPPSDEFTVPDSDKDKIMHVSLPIGGDTVLMGSDSSSSFGPPPVVGSNFSISVDTNDKGEADSVFTSLSEGGKVSMPLQDTFWDSYFGSCTDKFGIQWMVSAPVK